VAVIVSGEGPDVVGERTDHPMARRRQHHRPGAGAPLLRPQLLAVGRGWGLYNWTDTPDHLPRSRGREVSLQLNVPEPPGIAAFEELGLLNNWDDRSCDQVPIRVEMKRQDRLDVEDILGAARFGRVLGAVAEVQVVLERHADQVADGILALFRQLKRLAL